MALAVRLEPATCSFRYVHPIPPQLTAATFDDLIDELFLKNPSGDEGFDGFAFETYGEQESFVRMVAGAEPDRVATILDVDGCLWLSRGYHHVNRFLYLVAKPGVTLPQFEDFSLE